MESYKKSRYNIFLPYDDNETIVFNGLTGAIGKFDDETMERFRNNTLTQQEIEILTQKGVLVPEYLNEIEKINADRTAGICNEKVKHFRIWTTSGCNARCYYCFEKGMQTINMSTSTADALVCYIDKLLNNNDILEIEWFGGEPLLNTAIIDYISTALLNVCSNKKCTYHASMISNDSLITEELATVMKNKWKIASIQITFDGYDEYYNRAKNYYNSEKYNFFNIIENVKTLANNDIFVSVRMNYDTTNYESLIKLIEFLHIKMKSYKKIGYYIYPIWDALNESDPDAFRTKTKADYNLIKLFDLLVDYGMNTSINVARLKYRKHQCKSCNKHSCAILADGKIVKCSETFNQILGDVWNGITDKEHYDFWISTELAEKCRDCIYLPLCQGGCKSSYFTRMPQCFAYKPIINDILVWYVSRLERK